MMPNAGAAMYADMSFDAVRELPLWSLRLAFSLTLLWLLAGVAVLVLRKSSAAVRHRAWALSVLASLLLPVLLWLLPEMRLGWVDVRQQNTGWGAGEEASVGDIARDSRVQSESETTDNTTTPPAAAEAMQPSDSESIAAHPAVASLEDIAITDAGTTRRIATETSTPSRGTNRATSGPHAWWLLLLAVPTVWGLSRIARAIHVARQIVVHADEIADQRCHETLCEVASRLAHPAHVDLPSQSRPAGGGVNPRRLPARQDQPGNSPSNIPDSQSRFAAPSLVERVSLNRPSPNPQSEIPNPQSPSVRLLQSAHTPVPLCVGWRTPAIILPADWREWSPETLRAVLAHEMSHVLRRDVAWQLLALVACALYWFHPLAWLAARRMRTERETACDDGVLRAGENPASYARILVDLAGRLNAPTFIPQAAVAMAAHADLEGRIRAILAADRSRLPVGRVVGRILIAGTLALGLVVAMTSPFSQRSRPLLADDAAIDQSSGDHKGLRDGWKWMVTIPEMKHEDVVVSRESRLKLWTEDGWLLVRRTTDDQMDWQVVLARATDPRKPEIKVKDALDRPRLELQYREYFIREGLRGKLRIYREMKNEDSPKWPLFDLAADRDDLGSGTNLTTWVGSWAIGGWCWAACGLGEDRPDIWIRLQPTTKEAGELSRGNAINGVDISAGGPVEMFYGDSEVQDEGDLFVATRKTRDEADDDIERAGSKNGKNAAANENATPKPAPEPGVVTGEVVRADDGAPVAGTLVLLREGRLFRATTDEQGRFRFEKIPPGHFNIWAHKDDLASPKERLVGEAANADGARFPHVRLTMRPGKQVKFTVISAVSGMPLEGTDIRVGFPDRRHVKTDHEGTAVVAGLLPEKYYIWVEAAGHAREEREIDLSDSERVTSQPFKLPRGGSVNGIVMDESGNPLPKADVNFLSSGTPSSTSGAWHHGTSFTTDAQGAFHHLHLPLNAAIKVSVSLQDYLPQQKEIALTDRQREQQLEFRLQKRPRGGSIAGIVTDVAGKPLAGARVENSGNNPNQKRETTTDAEGRFVLHDLLKGFTGYEIVARAPKFATTMQQVEPGTEEAPGNVAVRLQPGHTIRGRVANEAGEPLKSAYVSANGVGTAIGETVRTNDDGEFAFDSLPENSKFQIHATGYPLIHNRLLPLDGNEIVVVTLESAVSLKGRVIDAETRQPIQEFRIRAGYCHDRRPTDVNGSHPNALSAPGMLFQSREGVFTINDMTKGAPLEIVVEAEGYERTVIPRVVAGTSEAAAAKEIAIRKRDESQRAAVTGKVVDHRANGIAGVQLRLIVTGDPATGDDDNRFNWVLIDVNQLGGKSYVEQYLSAVTDVEGKFEFKNLLPGKFLQIAYWGTGAPKGRWLALTKTKAGEGQSTIIKVPEPAAIRGSFDAVLFPKASEILLHRVPVAFDMHKVQLADQQTEFRIDNVAPGEYWVQLVGPSERHKDNPQMFSKPSLASRKLKIEPGKTHDIRFTENDRAKPR